MVNLLNIEDMDFESQLNQLLDAKTEMSPETHQTVSQIIADIVERGDEALLEYTNKFDRTNYAVSDIKVSGKEIEAAYRSCDPKILSALKTAAKRIEGYHTKQMPDDCLYQDAQGVELGWKWSAIGAVGLYVPGGLAAYPSSVLMNAIPAKVAGVKRLAMVVPTPDGVVNPVVLAAAKIAGIDEIYKVGGAQAVAALAYGTQTIAPVCKIVGPGNAYVAAAKTQVFGKVGIDMIAGPSEILVIADKTANPEWVAMDLLSQAEHDENARSILISDDEDVLRDVQLEVENTLGKLQRQDIARKSWENNGIIIAVRDLDQAVEIANKIATEHLEICTEEPKEIANKITNAGAIFVGKYTPEAIGDYIAGPSHVLPTSSTALFSSGLGVFDFIKRSSIINCSPEAFHSVAQEAKILAEEEGLDAHAKSISIRQE